MWIGLCNGSSGSCSDRSSYSVALSGTLPGPSQRPLGRSAIMFMSSFDILSIFTDIFSPVHALPLPPTEQHSWAGLTFFSFPTYICLKYIPLFSLQEQDIYFISTMFSPVYTCTIFVILLPLLMVHSHLQPDLHPWIMVTPEHQQFALKCLQTEYGHVTVDGFEFAAQL